MTADLDAGLQASQGTRHGCGVTYSRGYSTKPPRVAANPDSEPEPGSKFKFSRSSFDEGALACLKNKGARLYSEPRNA